MGSKAKKTKRGIPIKLSAELAGWLNRKRKQNESYDSMLRRHFGYPSRKGEAQPLREYFIIPNGNQPAVFTNEAEARGAAILLAVKKQHKKTEAVITAREVI